MWTYPPLSDLFLADICTIWTFTAGTVHYKNFFVTFWLRTGKSLTFFYSVCTVYENSFIPGQGVSGYWHRGTGKSLTFFTVCIWTFFTVCIWNFIYFRPGRVWLLTSRLGTGKIANLFYSVCLWKFISRFYCTFRHGVFSSYLKFPHSPCDMRVFNLVSIPQAPGVRICKHFSNSLPCNSKKITKISLFQLQYRYFLQVKRDVVLALVSKCNRVTLNLCYKKKFSDLTHDPWLNEQ